VICSTLKKALKELEQCLSKHNIVCLGNLLLADNKLKGVKTSWLEEIAGSGVAPYILVEADGAARKPIKGFAPFEPVIPSNASLLLPVLGLDALGLNLDSKDVHRPELLGKITGALPGEKLNVSHINHYLGHTVKIGMEAVPRTPIIPVINKMDLISNLNPIKKITGGMAGYPAVNRVLFTSLQETAPLKFILDPARRVPFVSCVILAAGCSKRMGKNKLALKLKGKTILEHTVNNALKSKVGEVIVVTRPTNGWVKNIFPEHIVKTVINPLYRQGVSTSLKTGLTALHPLSQGVVFALGDQPFITTEVYNSLIENYASKMNLVTCPLFKEKRGNPVLFDRRTWPLLLNLKGDIGGRQIFAGLPKNEICNVETSCPGILQDIDTAEDYQRALFYPC